MTIESLVVRVITGVVVAAAAFAVALEAHESLELQPTWAVEKRKAFLSELKFWKDPLTFIFPALAFLLVLVVLAIGLQRIVGPILGLGASLSSDEDRTPIGALLGFMVAVGLTVYVGKVRSLATRAADLEDEVAIEKALRPLRSEWGDAWKKSFEGLQAELSKLEGDPWRDRRRAAVIRAAIERAHGESWRGNKDNVLVPRSEWRPQNSDITANIPELTKIVGQRIAGFTFSRDGRYLQLDFADGACFVMPAGSDLLQGRHHGSFATALADLSASARMPALDSLHRVTFEHAPSAQAFNQELRYLFIDLWGKATSSPRYVKAEWGQLDGMLTKLGMRAGHG